MLSSTIASANTGASGSNLLSWALWAIAILLIFFILISVSDSMIGIEAKKSGVDGDFESGSSGSFLGNLFKPSLPEGLEGKSVKVLKQGHDIKLEGVAAKTFSTAQASTFAVQPKNFIGMSPIPKVTVEVGDEVKAGDVVLFDKKRSDIKYVAPVSGEIIAVNRGEKRSIKEVVILADKQISYRQFDAPDLATSSREGLVNFLLGSGAWAFIGQLSKKA